MVDPELVDPELVDPLEYQSAESHLPRHSSHSSDSTHSSHAPILPIAIRRCTRFAATEYLFQGLYKSSILPIAILRCARFAATDYLFQGLHKSPILLILSAGLASIIDEQIRATYSGLTSAYEEAV